MTGRHRFSDLEAGMPLERRTRIDRIAEELANQVAVEGSDAEGLPQTLLQLLRTHPTGLTRQEICHKLKTSGDGPGEQSISDALNALAATHRIVARDRRFVPAE